MPQCKEKHRFMTSLGPTFSSSNLYCIFYRISDKKGPHLLLPMTWTDLVENGNIVVERNDDILLHHGIQQAVLRKI